VKLRHDEFSNQSKIWGLPGRGGGGQELTDPIATRLRFLIGETYSFLPSKDLFEDVLIDIAHQNRFHPVREWLDARTWDGVPRIDNWLRNYGGAEDTPFNRAVGRIFLIAAVRRVRRPGCKFDTMIVFESPMQGRNKSQAARLLAIHEEWFNDNLPLGAKPQEVIEQISGSWIVEFPELAGIATREVEHIKAFLSRQVDKARAAYGRRSESVPRQFVACGTTNDTEYLKNDERRFWPVRIDKFDLASLRWDIEQLWAEAAHYEAEGEPITLQEDLWPEATKVRAERTCENPYYVTLAESFSHKPWMTSKRVWAVLNIKPDQQAKARRAVGEALESLGFVRYRAKKPGVPDGCVADKTDEPAGCLRDETYYKKLGAKP
jgi:predicted P-loop ATPase